MTNQYDPEKYRMDEKFLGTEVALKRLLEDLHNQAATPFADTVIEVIKPPFFSRFSFSRGRLDVLPVLVVVRDIGIGEEGRPGYTGTFFSEGFTVKAAVEKAFRYLLAPEEFLKAWNEGLSRRNGTERKNAIVSVYPPGGKPKNFQPSTANYH